MPLQLPEDRSGVIVFSRISPIEASLTERVTGTRVPVREKVSARESLI